jgi:DNA-binding NtrC family response regulator
LIGEELRSEANHKVVFVVDDEPAVAKTLTAILLHRGYEVRTFTDPLNALQAADEIAPALLFTDVVMPRLNGLQLADKILQSCPACKVLLISGNASYLSEYSSDMNFQLLEKPAAIGDIMSAVQTLIGSAS